MGRRRFIAPARNTEVAVSMSESDSSWIASINRLTNLIRKHFYVPVSSRYLCGSYDKFVHLTDYDVVFPISCFISVSPFVAF